MAKLKRKTAKNHYVMIIGCFLMQLSEGPDIITLVGRNLVPDRNNFQ